MPWVPCCCGKCTPNLLTNGNADTGDLTGWTEDNAAWDSTFGYTKSSTGEFFEARSLFRIFYPTGNQFAVDTPINLTSDIIDLTPWLAELQLGTKRIRAAGWIHVASRNVNPFGDSTRARVFLDWYDDADSFLSSTDVGPIKFVDDVTDDVSVFPNGEDEWNPLIPASTFPNHEGQFSLPTDAEGVSMRLQVETKYSGYVGNPWWIGFDDLKIRVCPYEDAPPS